MQERAVSFGKGLLGVARTQEQAEWLIASSGGSIKRIRNGYVVGDFDHDPDNSRNKKRIEVERPDIQFPVHFEYTR